MPGRYDPVAWDKRIHEQADGTYVLVLRADDRSMVIPRPTLLAAQNAMDILPPDGGEPLGSVPRSVFNPTTKGI